MFRFPTIFVVTSLLQRRIIYNERAQFRVGFHELVEKGISNNISLNAHSTKCNKDSSDDSDGDPQCQCVVDRSVVVETYSSGKDLGIVNVD